MSYVKPNHKVLIQCTTGLKPGSAWWIQTFTDTHADGCIAVLHKPKDVTQVRAWLEAVRTAMGPNFYIVIMDDLMLPENYLGRNNPNLGKYAGIPEIPEEYRTGGYPNGYDSIHPEKCLMQYTMQDFTPTAPEFSYLVKMGGKGGASWGQGRSVYNLFFGPDAIYDGKAYFHVWDVAAGNIDVPYYDPANPTVISWEYIQQIDPTDGKLKDYVLLHNADITHTYRAWVIDRNVTSIVPIDPEDTEPYYQYFRFLMDGYGDLIDGFYCNSSAFPRNGIINPPLQARQDSKYGPDGSLDLHLMDTSIWDETNTYATRVSAGTPNYRSYCWWRTVRDCLKSFYSRLMELAHSRGVAFGWSSSEMKQWAFTIADELGDFADQRVDPVTAIPGYPECVAMPSHEIYDGTTRTGILDWTNKKLVSFVSLWRFNAGGGIIWWLSTLSAYTAFTDEQRTALKDATDLFHDFWTKNPATIPKIAVLVVSEGSKEGRVSYIAGLNHLPVMFLRIGWLPLAYEVGTIPTCDLVYVHDTEWLIPGGIPPLFQPSVDLIKNWVMAGKGLLTRPNFDKTWLNISIYGKRLNTANIVDEPTRSQYSLELGVLLPSSLSAPIGKDIPFFRSDGASLEGVTKLYIVPGDPVGAFLLAVQRNLPGKISYFKQTPTDFDTQYQAIATLLQHKLFYWTANKSNLNALLIGVDKELVKADEVVTVSGWLITEDGVPIPNEEVVLTVNGTDFLTTTSGDSGFYTFSLSFADPGTYVLQTQAQRWMGTLFSQTISVTVVEIPPLAIDVDPKSADLIIGESKTFTATVTGGVPPYTISWIDNTTKDVIGTDETYTFNAVTEGLYEIYVEAKDSQGTVVTSPIVPITVSAPPPMGILSVDTTPVKGEVFVDGVSWGVAPQSRSLSPGTYIVSFGDVAGYVTPAPQTAVVLQDQTTNIIGEYILKTHSLAIDSTPITGVQFTIDGASKVTPYSEVLVEGTYIITMPNQVVADSQTYNFEKWTDDVLENPRTIDLLSDMSLTAKYVVPAPTQGTLIVKTTPVDGDIYVDNQLVGKGNYTGTLNPGTYTVSFGDVKGYKTPEPITAEVVAGQTTTITGLYTPISPLKRAVPILAPLGIGIVLYWLSQKRR